MKARNCRRPPFWPAGPGDLALQQLALQPHLLSLARATSDSRSFSASCASLRWLRLSCSSSRCRCCCRSESSRTSWACRISWSKVFCVCSSWPTSRSPKAATASIGLSASVTIVGTRLFFCFKGGSSSKASLLPPSSRTGAAGPGGSPGASASALASILSPSGTAVAAVGPGVPGVSGVGATVSPKTIQ